MGFSLLLSGQVPLLEKHHGEAVPSLLRCAMYFDRELLEKRTRVAPTIEKLP